MSVSGQNRIESLDFLRGVASLSVCWFHLTSFHYPTPDGPLYQMVRSSGAYGWLGVEVFFVISGFVIPYSLDRAGYILKDYLRFVLKRLVRLDPPYLATVVLLLILAYAYSFYSGREATIEGAAIGFTRVLLHLGYLNMFFKYEWLNPSFWTLAIEFQYYLLVGLAYPLLNHQRRLIRLAALLCFAATGFFGARGFVEGNVPYGRFIFYFAPLFAMGIVTFQRQAGLMGRIEYLVLVLTTGVATFVTLGVAAAISGLAAVSVINFYHKKNLIATFFGNISYSLYLLHWPVGHLTLSLVGSKLLGATGDSARIFVVLIALGVCIASAYLLYLLVERPAQRWSAAIKYGTKSRRTTAAEVSGFAPTLPAQAAGPAASSTRPRSSG